MIWSFAGSLILLAVFFKLGATVVTVNVLNAALIGAALAALALLLTTLWLGLKPRRLS